MRRLFVLFGFLFAVFSCVMGPTPSTPPESVQNNRSPAPPVERDTPKKADPVKMEICSKRNRTGSCEEEEKCKDICDDIFSSRGDRRKCYAFSDSLVESFEELLEATEDGDTDEIDPEILDCMLDIDEREFAKAVKKMSRREASDFLVAIADDDYLAKVLEEEDDEFNILKQLLHKSAGSNNLISQLKKEIEDGKSFFQLAAESSESGWEWLDSYVEDVCEKTSSSDICPGGESIGSYCTALLDFRDRDLKDFLSETDLFAERYEDEVQDADYLYEVEDNPDSQYLGDFRDWCREEGGLPSPCPANGTPPPDAQKLADITPAAADADKAYAITGVGPCFKGPGDASGSPRFPNTGSSNPDQEILLFLNDYRTGQMILNNAIIDYDSDKSYYLYIDSARYELEGSDLKNTYADDCTGSETVGDELTLWEGFLGSFDFEIKAYSVWLASEENGQCEYYQED